MLYNLACNPDKQEKLRSEVESVIRTEGITFESVQKISYLRNCIRETLRLYPILFINGREIKESFVTQNHNIQFHAGVSKKFFHIQTHAQALNASSA